MTAPHALAPGVALSAADPVVLAGSNNADMTNHVAGIALRSKAFTWWWIAIALPAALTGVLVGSILYLFYAGVGIWGIDWPVAWGFAIINYVWWIAIASGGTFISALFYLTRSEWRSSVNRIAESMTLFGAACAGIYPILHLGRPWLFYWLFPYPDSMDVWPQFRSPLLWDFFAILTYVTSSVLFWYLGLLPDLATLRDRASGRVKQRVYGVLALGFRGTGRQWQHYHTLYGVLAAIMAPLVCSVHSIVGLDFAGAATNGWHSTMYPPFFIFGAFLSGFATVLLLIMPMRRLLRLERYITGRHLDVLGRLLLTSSLFVGLAYVMDLFSTYYGGEKAEIVLYQQKVFGYYAGIFWATVLFNVLLPQLLWFRALRLNQPVVALISIGVIIGMWCERFTIVVVSLHRPRLPSSYGLYHGTVWDWLTMMGTVGLFVFGILLIVRLVPVISMFEMREIVAPRRP
jgi:molybdopterin-containing oxidoreductase family membrane subunit